MSHPVCLRSVWVCRLPSLPCDLGWCVRVFPPLAVVYCLLHEVSSLCLSSGKQTISKVKHISGRVRLAVFEWFSFDGRPSAKSQKNSSLLSIISPWERKSGHLNRCVATYVLWNVLGVVCLVAWCVFSCVLGCLQGISVHAAWSRWLLCCTFMYFTWQYLQFSSNKSWCFYSYVFQWVGVHPKLHHAHSLTFLLLPLSSFLTSCRDLGVHIDGFIANVAHSFVVGASKVKAVVELGGGGLVFYCYSFFLVCLI